MATKPGGKGAQAHPIFGTTKSRFASVVLDGVMGLPRLARPELYEVKEVQMS